MKPYVMKDLGYPRTPTSAEMIVSMTNGSNWSIPVQIIADSRDSQYTRDKEDTVKLCKDNGDTHVLLDWVSNDMNWEDVKDYAKELTADPYDYRCL